jgi:serine/threonine protein kinase
MAPEIHMRKPYSGASVDLFAAGIILFIMVTQHPPFTVAKTDDPFYKLICANRHDLFWKAHSKNKPEGFFSEEFIHLINGLISFDPAQRISMEQVKGHPWMSGATATLHEA